MNKQIPIILILLLSCSFVPATYAQYQDLDWRKPLNRTIQKQATPPPALFEQPTSLRQTQESPISSSIVRRIVDKKCKNDCLTDAAKDIRVRHTFLFQSKEIAKQIFDGKGTLIRESGFIPDGKVIEWDPETGEYIELHYNRNKINGTVKYRNNESQVIKEVPYQHGVKNGISRTYYLSGELKKEQTFKNDKTFGPYTSYYESGEIDCKGKQLNKRENFVGILETCYHPNGIVRKTEFYNTQSRTAVIKSFREDGTLEKEQLVNRRNDQTIVKYFDKYGVNEIAAPMEL